MSPETPPGWAGQPSPWVAAEQGRVPRDPEPPSCPWWRLSQGLYSCRPYTLVRPKSQAAPTTQFGGCSSLPGNFWVAGLGVPYVSEEEQGDLDIGRDRKPSLCRLLLASLLNPPEPEMGTLSTTHSERRALYHSIVQAVSSEPILVM